MCVPPRPQPPPHKPGQRQHPVCLCAGTPPPNTHTHPCAQAKAFALLSEEGIAKGVRRIVAVTASDAAAAIAEGDALTAKVEAAAALPDTELAQV